MKTKNVLRILAIAFAMVMMLAIASCDLLLPEETTTAHVHSETVLAAVEATCTETGLTEGKKCTTCGQVTVPQQVVPAKGHTEEVVAAVEATCTSIGLTEGKKCSVCDVTLKAQDIVPAKGHTPKDVAAIPATCTQQGLTAGKICSVCDAILEAQELIDALGHTPGAAATCTTNQTCTVCKAELAPANGHDWGTEVTTVTAPTCAADGKGTVKCKNCDATKEQAIPATGEHTWDAGVVTTAPSCADGVRLHTCSVCKGTKEEAIPGNGQHAYGEEVVVAPATCTTTGYKSKTCTICNTVKKVELAAKGGSHAFVEGKCTNCGTCEKHSYQKYTQNDTTDPRYNLQWGVCEDCGYVDVNHEHLIKNGVCYYCEYVYDEVPQGSIVDNDGDRKTDIFYFAQALPERFRDNLIYVNAKRDDISTNYGYYDEVDEGKKNPPLPYPHHYAPEKSDKYLEYKVTVDKSGTYEVAIYLRVKDEKIRGAKFTINEGTPSEYSFETSYAWPTADDRAEVQNNSFLIGVYMFVEMELHEGENTFKITTPHHFEKSQHFRGFFFNLKEEQHVHGYIETVKAPTCLEEGLKTYTCSCGNVVTEKIDATGHTWGTEITTVTAPTCTTDGKGTVKCDNCDATEERVIPATGHAWGTEITTVTAPTCTVDGKGTVKCDNCDATEERVISATHEHTLDESYKCSVCGNTYTLTQDAASELGLTLEKGAKLPDLYYITVTFNNGAPRNNADKQDGFCRVKATNGSLMSVYNIILAEGQEMPKAGDTVLLECVLGCVNSTVNGNVGKEARIFDAKIVKVVAECDHAAGWTEATCIAPKTCKTCGRTEGEAAGAHIWDAEYTKCTVCGEKILTPEEAYAIGIACAKDGEANATTEVVYLKITLDHQVNVNGFARGTLEAGLKYISVAGGYTNNEITFGDTVVISGVMGKVGSTLVPKQENGSNGFEARMFKVTLVKNISAACEHDWSEATECGATYTCSKCKAVRILAHDWNITDKKCNNCDAKLLSVDEAITIGKATTKPSSGDATNKQWTAEQYYVYVTFNVEGDGGNPQKGTDGFCRVYAADGTTKMGIKKIVLVGGQTMPTSGDVVVLLANIGQTAGGEVRLYNAAIANYIPAQ